MGGIVIEHVKISELPERWRTKLHVAEDARVTVHIEEEAKSAEAAQEYPNDPLFGMWRDREEMADVEAYVRKLRAPRF